MNHPAALAFAVLTASPLWAQELPSLPLRPEFDPAATAALTASGEKVAVSAWFYGPPSSKWIGTDQMGLTTVRWEEITLEPVDQTVQLGEHIGQIAMDWVAKPFLNVNVYSARQSGSDNILDCGMIDEPLGRLRQRVAVITCELLDY
jgi:hypothetical protein